MGGGGRVRVPRVAAIDGFRAYAIAGVVLLHLLAVSGVLAASGGTLLNTAIWGLFGNVIDAFFIISGFVLFLPVVVRGGSLGGIGAYALGRAARLLPAYWLCLLLALALVLALPPSPLIVAPSAADVAIHAGALQMPVRLLDPGLAVGFGVDGPLWMISVIVGFYFVFPLIAGPYFRRPLAGLAAAAAITLAWKELALHGGLFEALAGGGAPAWAVELVAIDQLPAWAFSFGLGMTGAWLWVRLQSRPPELLARRALQLLPLAVLAYAVFALAYGSTAETFNGTITGSLARSDPLQALGSSAARAALMAAIAVGPLWLRRPFTNRLTARLAELSYGLYLIHFVVIVYAVRYLDLPVDGSGAAFALWCALVLPLSLVYGYASRRWVEQPIREWVRGREPAGAARAPAGFQAEGAT